MSRKILVWTGVGLLAAGSLSAAGTATEQPVKSKFIMLADSSGESGGEGGAGVSPELESDLEFLTALSLVEAHATLAVELSGSPGAAEHMMHPAAELLKELLPELERRKLPGFMPALDALAAAISQAKPAEEVKAEFAKLAQALTLSRGPLMAKAEVAVPVALRQIRKSTGEYAEGVKDGKVVELEEYQDAWGITAAARGIIANLPAAERTEYAGPVAEIEAEFARLNAAWPQLDGSASVAEGHSLLAAAVARMDLAAFDIK